MYTCTFTEGKAHTCWKTKFLSVVFGPWYFGIGPWYSVRGIHPRYHSYVVLDHGIKRGLNLYKEKKIIRPKCKCASDEYMMKCEIWYVGYGFVMLYLI